jgi:O-antigen/teichoic acid export membrane protein
VLGLYTLAGRLAKITQKHLNPLVTRVAFPAFAKKQQNLPALRGGLMRIQTSLAYVTLPLLVGLFLTSETFVPLVYGPTGADVVPIVNLLVWPAIFATLTGSMGATLLALGRVRLLFGWALSSFCIWGVLLWVSLQGGFESFLITRSAYGVASSIVFAAVTLRLLGSSLSASLPGLWRPLVATLVMSLAVLLAGQLPAFGPPSVGLAVQVVVGALAFAVTARRLDREFLDETVLALLNRRPRAAAPADRAP